MTNRLTKPQQKVLRWLWLAAGYSRWVYGGELRTARSLVRRGMATLEQRDGDWFATTTNKERLGVG